MLNILPVQTSPDSLFFRGIDKLNHSENKFLKHGVARFVQIVAIPVILPLSVLYNGFAFTVKMPFVLGRYTFGFIPTAKGKLADQFPNDTKASHMAWHAYKIMVFWIDVLPLYVVGAIHPRANVYLHVKLRLIPEFGIKTSSSIPTAPPLPPLSVRPNRNHHQVEIRPQHNEEVKKDPVPKRPPFCMNELQKASQNQQAKRDTSTAIGGQGPNKPPKICNFNMSLANNFIEKSHMVGTHQASDEPNLVADAEWNLSSPSREPSQKSTMRDDSIGSILFSTTKHSESTPSDQMAPPSLVVSPEIARSPHYEKMAKIRTLTGEDVEDLDDSLDFSDIE